LIAYSREASQSIQIGLGTTEGFTHIFVPELVCSQVDGAIGTAAYLLLDDILVDAVVEAPVRVVIRVFGPCVECFLTLISGGRETARVALSNLDLAMRRGRPPMVSHGALKVLYSRRC